MSITNELYAIHTRIYELFEVNVCSLTEWEALTNGMKLQIIDKGLAPLFYVFQPIYDSRKRIRVLKELVEYVDGTS